ncbi:hypothetical protein EG328_008400 [Venturia inaequalis]|uniref:Uncharacterized protein n=1 Tax=Venturia inaequalis TaxID=5025 RepID=A0A8H3UCJ2_VENIN|nr:hypothetical protein EG328_008400 [Venturia inaequalis]KAE9990819.1 hypothetical protein EG327_000910 [Venturia inaequalis]RDI76605.1 hypothetical protein Vi05172_g13401 [Venturia inaequalis]
MNVTNSTSTLTTTSSTLSTTSTSSESSTISTTEFIGVFIAGTPLCLVLPTTLSGTVYGIDGMKTYLDPNNKPYVTAIQSNGIVPAVLAASICRGSSGYSSTSIDTATLSRATEVAPTSSTMYPASLSNANGISAAAIAGIVVGVLVVPSLALLGMCVFKERRRRRQLDELVEDEKHSQSPEKDRLATSLVNIGELAVRKKAAKERLQQLEKEENQKMEMRGALRA